MEYRLPPERRPRSKAALKQARRRARQRAGIWRCCWVPVAYNVVAALIDRGLPDEASRDPRAIGEELDEILRLWAQRWFEEKHK
jgi:hypothetical protein